VYTAVWGDIQYIWFDFNAHSYLDWAQVVGVMFSRETAVEARRRALIVRPFELERYWKIQSVLNDTERFMADYLFRPDLKTPSLDVTDLVRVCAREEGVDVVVLPHAFTVPTAAGYGRVVVYECTQVRAHQSQRLGPAPHRGTGVGPA
jgi:hypothetical protein